MLKRCLALPQSVHGDMIGWFSSGRVGCVAAGDGTPGICREWSFCMVLVESPLSTGGLPSLPALTCTWPALNRWALGVPVILVQQLRDQRS